MTEKTHSLIALKHKGYAGKKISKIWEKNEVLSFHYLRKTFTGRNKITTKNISYLGNQKRNRLGEFRNYFIFSAYFRVGIRESWTCMPVSFSRPVTPHPPEMLPIPDLPRGGFDMMFWRMDGKGREERKKKKKKPTHGFPGKKKWENVYCPPPPPPHSGVKGIIAWKKVQYRGGQPPILVKEKT